MSCICSSPGFLRCLRFCSCMVRSAFALMLQKVTRQESFRLFSINKRNFHEKKHLLEAKVFWWLSGQKLDKICKKGLLILGNRGSKFRKISDVIYEPRPSTCTIVQRKETRISINRWPTLLLLHG